MNDKYREIFKVGGKYKPKRDFTSGRWKFFAGEFLVFVRAGYSWYDGCYTYSFEAADAETKIWMLADREPPDTWKEYFDEAVTSEETPPSKPNQEPPN